MRIGIVAGEASGDKLGTGLILALKERCPTLEFEGVAGSQMLAAGCRALYSCDQLSVMGLVEIIGHYRRLARIRQNLVEHFLADPPDVFIGIDYPKFNLGLEEQLKAKGIPTVHYVSPQVWAWREWRLKQIARAVDRILVLLPFEEQYYRQHKTIPATFVGHPLADEIPLTTDKLAVRKELGLAPQLTVIALLPGSRGHELHYHSEPLLRTAAWLYARRPELHFAVPFINAKAQAHFLALRGRLGLQSLPMSFFEGRSREVMGTADVILTSSGTATLEAMLIKRPMVVIYRMNWLSYCIARLMVRVPFFSLPNLLTGHRLVPEILQADVRPEVLGPLLLEWLDNPEKVADFEQQSTTLHRHLRRNASRQAADAVGEVLRMKTGRRDEG